jgi:hypothetical protein
MSDETIPLNGKEERLWKRAANWKEVLTVLLTLTGIIGGFVWDTKSQQVSTQSDVRQLRKDFDGAKLPEERDRLLKIEKDVEYTRRDVEWIRRLLEAKHEKP